MYEGALILWFILTGLSLLYIAYDLIFVTPEASVMKVGWFLLTVYTGVIGLVFYLLSCKEPMPDTHEAFIKKPWKQALGSMVHCLAGDVTGIILAAIILAFFQIGMALEIAIEYLAGFGFGLFIFQALFMRKVMMQSYSEAVRSSFYPEFTSMNMIMSGMIPVMVLYNVLNPLAQSPLSIHFWAKMSMATLFSGCVAFPMNFWLVKHGIKHGMMTIRGGKMEMMHHEMPEPVSREQKKTKLLLSVASLLLACIVAIIFYFAI